MDPTDRSENRKYRLRLFALFGAVSLFLILQRVDSLLGLVQGAGSGEPDLYPNQHQLLILSSVEGILSAFILPFPFLFAWLGNRRKLLVPAVIVWAALLGTSICLGVQQRALMPSR